MDNLRMFTFDHSDLYFVDNNLAQTFSVVAGQLAFVKDIKTQIAILHVDDSIERVELQKEFEESTSLSYNVICASLLDTAINSMYSIVCDEPNRSFGHIANFRNKEVLYIPEDSIAVVIKQFYMRAWERYTKHYRDDLERLRVHRNNISAHNTPAPREYRPSDRTLNSGLALLVPSDQIDEIKKRKYIKFELQDFLSDYGVFSNKSLDFLAGLIFQTTYICCNSDISVAELEGLYQDFVAKHGIQ